MHILIKPFRIIVLMTFVIFAFACCHKSQPTTLKKQNKTKHIAIASILSPKNDQVFTWGDSVKIDFEIDTTNVSVDSIRILSNNNIAKTVTGDADLYWNTSDCRTGRNTGGIKIYYNDNLSESHSFNIILLSDIIPENYSYQVIHTYPHDSESYTQGLLYHNGFLYESTGLEEKSTLRINDIKTGKPEKIISLNPDIFAEGITLYNDQLYQITYKSRIGFIYDVNTLELIRNFDYQIPEGWGLATDSKNLVMSDGSQHLYIMEPEFFTQIDQLDVYDHSGMISLLNELEFVNGKILANVYGETYIVIIDLETGKVTGKIDMDKLMPEGTKGNMGKVLNGIAYNPQNQHYYITGKNWPVLYEITISPSR